MQEVLLVCPCPDTCKCGNRKNKQWRHVSCKTNTYINDEGDLYCEKHKNDSNQCSKYFIQHASFKCSDSSTTNKFRSIADTAMAIAQAMKAAELNMNDKDSQKFIQKLNSSIANKWKY